MIWNWQQKEWPNFSFEADVLASREAKFMQSSGVFYGAYKHITEDEKKVLLIDIICEEALKTSEIEGEYLSRDSIQSSIRKHFGLQPATDNIPPAEQGISDMMLDVFENFTTPLDHKTMHAWHRMLMANRRDIKNTGGYRTHSEAIQVVSGYAHKPIVHFEAPPSDVVSEQMEAFVNWFNATAPNGKNAMPAMTRASIAHLYFVSIHPYEDGNGRIARALTQKALAQSIGQASLIALSQTIQSQKNAYYDALEANNKNCTITDWLTYFSDTILTAQNNAETLLDFILAKTKLFDRLKGQINERQTKALARMFRAGPEGFTGGMNADKYVKITSTSRATATRDLQDLVEKQALSKTGKLKGTRYWLIV
ncbi:MAG: Fic family protein [Kordiimonadaceae bacterium]|nr:Fic family protein [Kordiimonadaceae bacterium]